MQRCINIGFSVFLLICSLLEIAFAQPVVIISPKSSNASSSKQIVEGVVTEKTIKNIDIAVVNLLELVEEPSLTFRGTISKKEETSLLENLSYKTISVENMCFKTQVELKYGINVIVTKITGKGATDKNVQMKVLVLDKTSSEIVITSPKSNKINHIENISGEVKKETIKDVKITVEALVKVKAKKTKSYEVHKIVEEVVPVKNRSFQYSFSIPEELTGIEFLVIKVIGDDIEVTKTLF